MQTIQDIMTPDVQTISPQESVRRAAQLMDELNVGAIPVCDGDRLVVHLRGVGEVAGQVSWVRGDRIGMMFDRRIDPQAARKPVSATSPGDVMPAYLRPLPRVAKFGR